LGGNVANRCLKWGQRLKRSASKHAAGHRAVTAWRPAGVFPLADIPLHPSVAAHEMFLNGRIFTEC
jgi:hypothetical protein